MVTPNPRMLLALVLTVPLIGAGTAAASPAAASPAEGTSAQVMGVVSQPFTISAATTARFVLRVPTELINTPGVRLEFRLHRRVAGRDPFRAIAAGEVQSAVVDSVSYPLIRLARNDPGFVTADVPIRTTSDSGSSITMRFAGVYPMTVRVVDVGGVELAASMTFLNKRTPVEVGPDVQATVVARLAPEASIRTDGLVEIQEDTRAAIRRFVSFLTSAPDNLTVSVRPEVVASLAGSIEPIDVGLFTDLRTQLRRRTLTAAAFADTDPSIMAARGLGDEFITQVRLGERTLDRHLPGVPIRRGMWVGLHRLDEKGVGLLRDAGINTVLLMAAGQTELSSGRPIHTVAAVRPANGADMPVIAVESLLAPQLSVANPFPEQAALRVVAEAIVIRDELLAVGVDPSRVRLVVGSSDGRLYDDATLLAVARTLRATPGFAESDMSTGQSVTDADPDVVLPEPVARPRDGLTNAIRGLRRTLNAVLSMVSDDDPQRDTWRHLLGLTTAASATAADYGDALRASLRSTLEGVSVTSPGSINLSSRTGSIRLQLRNDSPHQLRVRVRVTSAKLEIARRTVRVDLASGATTEVEFEARTRTNGRFPVVVRVLTPEGNVDVVPSVTFTARVSALAGFGQLVSITLLLMLLAWWWSHRRRTSHIGRADVTDPNSENPGPSGTVLSS